jgi:hypothetical protein
MASSDIVKLNTYLAGTSTINGVFPITVTGSIGCNVSTSTTDYSFLSETGKADPYHLWGMEINVQYSNTVGPCPGGHQCDQAQFYLMVEGINIGLVDLNNYSDGGDRNTVLSLNIDKNSEFYDTVNSTGVLNLQLECAYDLCHSNVPWVTVTNGEGNIIYNGCPATNTFIVPLS